jgi:hypothetical protein
MENKKPFIGMYSDEKAHLINLSLTLEGNLFFWD